MKTSLTTFLHQQCFKTTTTCLLILLAVASGHAEQAQQPEKASFSGRSWVASDHPDQALQPVIKDPSVFPVLDIADRAPTPPMGFSFWNAFASDGSCDLYVRQTAEALVAKGLKDCGYDMLLAFDGSWYSTDVDPGRDADGRMLTDAKRWPNGIKAVCDFVHSKGLKVGGYTDIGPIGYCTPRQRGFQPQDVKQYEEWGWDYIKIDDNGKTGWLNVVQPLVTSLKRPIIISLSTPNTFPFELAPRIANMWRVGGDILIHPNDKPSPTSRSNFGDVLKQFDAAERYWWAQAPGRWNDLDIMVVGCRGISDEEAKSHFSLWAIRGAPLLIGTDFRDPALDPEGIYPKINDTQLGILKNREVIAVDQDSLGASGRKVKSTGGEAYAKPLQAFTSGKVAVLFLNRSEAASDIRVNWSSLGLKTGKAKVRDLWAHSDLGVPVDGWTAKAVPPHGVVMLIVQGEYDWDRSRSYEAESSYNTFAGLARQRCKLTGFSSTAGVVGVGNGKDHSLQFNRMAAPTAGPYTLDIFYACNGERHAEMSVNGKETMPIVFPATGNDQLVGMVTVEVSLQAGEGNAIRFANTSGPAPVFDRIRIRPSGSVLPVAEAKLLRIDDNTKGHWQSIFGKSGFTIPGGPVTTSDLATVACEESIFVWAATTDDRRALNTGETNKGIASCRYDPNQISVGVSVAAGKMAQVALYVCDWTREKRAMRVSVIDQGTWIERCSADVAQFDQGRWLVFQVKGDVQFRLTKTEGTNVVLGGVFIDPVIP